MCVRLMMSRVDLDDKGGDVDELMIPPGRGFDLLYGGQGRNARTSVFASNVFGRLTLHRGSAPPVLADAYTDTSHCTRLWMVLHGSAVDL